MSQIPRRWWKTGDKRVRGQRIAKLNSETLARQSKQIFLLDISPGAGLDERINLLSQSGGIKKYGTKRKREGEKTEKKTASSQPRHRINSHIRQHAQAGEDEK